MKRISVFLMIVALVILSVSLICFAGNNQGRPQFGLGQDGSGRTGRLSPEASGSNPSKEKNPIANEKDFKQRTSDLKLFSKVELIEPGMPKAVSQHIIKKADKENCVKWLDECVQGIDEINKNIKTAYGDPPSFNTMSVSSLKNLTDKNSAGYASYQKILSLVAANGSKIQMASSTLNNYTEPVAGMSNVRWTDWLTTVSDFNDSVKTCNDDYFGCISLFINTNMASGIVVSIKGLLNKDLLILMDNKAAVIDARDMLQKAPSE